MPILRELTLENYKAYARQARISLKPLTLFYGYNSAGKSSAVRFLQLLADSANGTGVEPLNLQSEVLKGSTFKDLLSKYTASPAISFGLTFDDEIYSFTIFDLPDHNVQIIERFEIKIVDSSETHQFVWTDWASDAGDGRSAYQYTTAEGTVGLNLEIDFDGLIPTCLDPNFDGLFQGIVHNLKSFSEKFYSLGSNCIGFPRYQVAAGIAKTVARNGEGIASILHYADASVIETISNWFQNATGYSFQRNSILIGDKLGFRFTLHPNADDNIDVDIVDTGEGMGQVLPVIALLALASNGALSMSPTFAFEHPELHLHPDAHGHLAKAFCEAVTSEFTPTVIVETHSENLLLGIQIAIAQKKISSKDVAVHWVQDTPEGAVVQIIEFDDKARPIGDHWPVGVFAESTQLARELLDLRKT